MDDLRSDENKAGEEREIAVIGVACRTSGADTVEGFWDLLDRGERRIAPVPTTRVPGYETTMDEAPAPMAALLDHPDRFDADFFGIKPAEAAAMDPQHRALLEISWHALESAALTSADLAGEPVGVFAGVSSYDYRELALRRNRVSSRTLAGSLHAFLANRLSFHYDLRGPSITLDTACSSGLTALTLAVTALRAGQCSMALVGAANIICDGFYHATLQQAGVLSSTGRSVGFDTCADGYVRGDGVGCVVLKPLAAALRDGDPVYAVVAGMGMNHDGRSATLTAPSALAQASLIRSALADARVPGSAIGYLEAHGTGTTAGDPVEIAGIVEGLGLRDHGIMAGPEGRLWVGTVKANVGHTESAAGILGLLKGIGVLRRGCIPRTPGFTAVSPALELDGLPIQFADRGATWPRTGTPRLVGVNCFGFGGANAHVILREPPDLADRPGLRTVGTLHRFEGQSHWLDGGLEPALTARDALLQVPLTPAGHETPAQDPGPGPAEVLAGIKEDVAAVLLIPPDDLGDDDQFHDLGLDSILAVECVQKINQRFGGTRRSEVLRQFPSSRLLADHLLTELTDAGQRP
ncbi:phosphopantetheine-binding protein [Streptomyces sp. ET3-23]|uniref:beta-ketoacyl synthase N-terminal-like domain-containing protein n=1 Tax=Streptomyces sp. ET3-23 TaxID=2885643 RepID=UPI001D0FA76E|nr:beta-ketoacyl synthase N-terminal-like domain-containing protein [Streptomyces sp. ET3-23]MCC2280652.1 phosphopantetheine-binding protein [Streptomyces sp. ET3-23]